MPINHFLHINKKRSNCNDDDNDGDGGGSTVDDDDDLVHLPAEFLRYFTSEISG